VDEVKPYPTDSQVSTITLRHGNIDYVTNMVGGHPQSWVAEFGYTYCSRYT
jgi:hypothetical protein